MSTMALPICVLENSVRDEANKALAATESVVEYSKAVAADFKTIIQIISGTAGLRRRLASLVARQAKFITALQAQDFSNMDSVRVRDLAMSLDELVNDERQVLRDAYALGSEIRFWWGHSLGVLSQQVEHLDSIAESLHIAGDEECSALMGMAAIRVAERHTRIPIFQ